MITSTIANKAVLALLAAIGLSALVSNPISAAELDLPKDGWTSWEVTAVPSSPAWCCYDYRNSKAEPKVCDLDSHQYGFGNRDDQKSSGTVRLYAQMRQGELKQIRTLDSNCPVRSKSAIGQLGAIEADVSATWLSARLQPRNELSEELMAALAVHAGKVARQALYRNADLPTDVATRKEAIFWLGQVRGIEAADFLSGKMRNDPSAKVREHAAFSISQSDAPNRTTALIEQGRSDESSKVRSQAWFWLAQTEDVGAEAAINAALAKEASSKVRDQQVFALSQLPDDRAAKALIALISNTQQPQQVRKQALFWLGQADSPEAYRYLDALLAGE